MIVKAKSKKPVEPKKKKKLVANFSINGEEKEFEFNGLRHLMSALIREEEMDGRSFLVCPTVLICEGVHNSVFYPADELKKFPDAWNGRPVVINHPDLNGKPITANSPQIVERQTVGSVYNTKWDKDLKKLIGEVWIDIEKCQKVAPEILAMLRDNSRVEVSTGLFTEGDEAPGAWQGEHFLGTVFNYRPDHLALLPNDKGACSWEDGAGMPRMNKEEETSKDSRTFRQYGQVFVENKGLVVLELSHDQISGKLRAALAKKHSLGKNKYLYLREVFDNYAVYAIENMNEVHEVPAMEGGQEKLYRIGYAVNGAEDEIELLDEPAEVKVEIKYVLATNAGSKENKTEGGNKSVAKQGGERMNKEILINALVKSGVKKEEDREALMALTDEQLSEIVEKAIAPEEEVKTEEETKETPTKNKEEEKTETKDENAVNVNVNVEAKLTTLAEVLDKVDDNMKAKLQTLVKMEEDAKAELIKVLRTDEDCPFTEEELKQESVARLRKLVRLAAAHPGEQERSADFSGMSPAINRDDSDVPAMPQLCPKKDK